MDSNYQAASDIREQLAGIEDELNHIKLACLPEWGALTMRDYFAAAALAGIMANDKAYASNVQNTAQEAYRLADAMIAERMKPNAQT